MTQPLDDSAEESPFHAGEQELQARVGKRDTMQRVGRRVLRTFMPEQHREFYAQLPFLVVGSVDDKGWPWASILSGKPGFAHSHDPTTLRVDGKPLTGDPLGAAIKPGAPLGLLGIELSTRRRNRLNARISLASTTHFEITVDQSFGNCPKYIQTRTIDFVDEAASKAEHKEVTSLTRLDEAARTMISSADTFFVSSYVQTKEQPTKEGVDVSHRGGPPGFVKIENNTLTIPDYLGNYQFNTLGNFLLNPKAGLVFADFDTGDLLMLTGTVEILWEGSSELQSLKSALRAWRFTLNHGLLLKNAMPFRAILSGQSK